LLAKLQDQKFLSNKSLSIYTQEAMWDKVLAYLQKYPALEAIKSFEQDLAPLYPEELVDLYDTAIVMSIKNSNTRSHYADACRYLRRMLKLGATAKVESRIADLRLQYPTRRALLEELDKV
jgi:hypothetical protein